VRELSGDLMNSGRNVRKENSSCAFVVGIWAVIVLRGDLRSGACGVGRPAHNSGEEDGGGREAA